jgi:hypothetical protein
MWNLKVFSEGSNNPEAILVVTIMALIAVIGIVYIIASMRRGTSFIGFKTKRLESFSTELSPEDTLKTIINFAQQTGYKIPALDDASGHLVLEESASILSWGFFFPVSVTGKSNNFTIVEVGVKPKIFQVGPLVSRSHEKCVSGIKAALFAQR